MSGTYLGIDVGTSGVKAILIDRDGPPDRRRQRQD